MKKLLLISLLLFANYSSANSQVTFRKSYLFSGNSSKIISTTDGGYLLVGTAYITDTSMNITGVMNVIKTDSSGDTLWTKTFLNKSSYVSSVFESFDHGYILTGGQTDSVIGFIQYRLFIKLDSLGNLIWKHHLPGQTNGNYITVYGFIQTPDSGFVLLEEVSDATLRTGVDLLKFNKDGFFQWYKRILPNNILEKMTGLSLTETPSGNLLLTGYNQTGPPPTYTQYNWLLETDMNGVILNYKKFNLSYHLYFNQIKKSIDNCTYLAGFYMDSVSGHRDPLIVKCDSTGNVLWGKTYPIQDTFEHFFDIISNPDLTNTFTYLYHDTNFRYFNNIIHIDTSGNILWSRFFANYNFTGGINSIILCPDNGYLLRFQKQDLIKTDSNGLTGCNDSTITSTYSPINISTTDITNEIHDSVGTFNHLNISLRDTTFNFSIATECFNINEVNDIKAKLSYFAIPNPFNDHTTIDVSNHPDNTYCNIYDINGKLLAKFNSANGKIVISNTGMTPGIYFGLLQSENKYLGCIKLIAQ